MGFVDRFRKKNTKLAAGSVRTYLSTIKRLGRLAKTKADYPETGQWLSQKGLLAKVKALPLNARKILGEGSGYLRNQSARVGAAYEREYDRI